MGREKIKKFLLFIVSLPKTMYFNFRVFKLSIAVHLPVIIAYNTKIRSIKKGSVVLENWQNKHYRVYFGFRGSENVNPNRLSFIDLNNSKLIFHGEAHFARGNCIFARNGTISFGTNFSANRNCFIESVKEISFGDNVLLGWNINIRDTDGAKHHVFENGNIKPNTKSISIGNHVWICSYSDLLKGTYIADESIIAWRSLVLGRFEDSNVLIGGAPAKIISSNINWER